MNYPKVCLDNKGNYFITLYLNHKRFRLYSGDKIGIDLKPLRTERSLNIGFFFGIRSACREVVLLPKAELNSATIKTKATFHLQLRFWATPFLGVPHHCYCDR